MKALLVAMALLSMAGVACAATAETPLPAPLLTIDWAHLKAAGKLTADEFVAPRDSAGAATVRLENPNDRPRTFTLITLDDLPRLVGPGPMRVLWTVPGLPESLSPEC
jgi:hypothetical protein